jgi:hypothetical protein
MSNPLVIKTGKAWADPQNAFILSFQENMIVRSLNKDHAPMNGWKEGAQIND